MAELDKKISALPEVTAAAIADADKFPVVAAGVTSYIRKSELSTVFGGGGGGTVVNTPAEGRTVPNATQYLANNAVYNILDYGAVGNDIADDTAAIAAAVAAARTNGGGRILVPLGTYKTNALAVFDIDFSNVEIFGEGRGSIIKLYADGSGDATDRYGVKITGTTSNVFIRDLRITSALATDTSRQNGIGSPSGQTLADIHIQNVEIDGTILGVSLNGNGGSLTRGSVRHSYIHDIKGSGSGTGYGIHLDTASESLIDNNVVSNVGRHGIYHARTVVGVASNNIISHNRILNHRSAVADAGYRSAIVVSRSQGVLVTGNVVANGYDGGLEISHATADPTDYNTKDITVTNNTFTGRKNAVPYIIVGEQLTPTTVNTSNVLIEHNKFVDDASVAQFPAAVLVLNGLYITIQNNNFRKINCNTAVTQRAIGLGVAAYASTLAHCNYVAVRSNTIIFEGTSLGDTRAISIDTPLADHNGDVLISDNTLIGTALMDAYDAGRTNTSMRIAGNNMPSTSAVADAGFYIGNTPFTGSGGGGGSPGGANTQMQYNNAGTFAGAATVLFDSATGNLAVGGSAPPTDTLLTVSAARDLQKLAFFNNTSPSGYGVRFQAGDNSKYGIKVSDNTGAGVFQVFGGTSSSGVVHLGPEGSALLTDLVGYAQNALNIEGNTVGHEAAILLTNSVFGSYPSVTNMIYASGDAGFRIAYNYRQPYVSGNSYSNNTLHQIQMSFETDGAWGLTYGKPYNTAAGTYDTGGKNVKIFGGGFPQGSGGQRTKYVMMTIGNASRGWQFGVTNGANTSDYVTRLQIEDSAASDAVSIWVGGALRKITVDGSGFLKAV